VSTAAQEFLRNAVQKSADLRHRQTIRRGIDLYNAAAERGQARFQDWAVARQNYQIIKWEAINHLDRYLLEFEQHVKARGGHAFWAENCEDARRYIVDLAVRRGVRTIVKSKSMVAEEIRLTPALEKQGISVFETDLGEFIVQLRASNCGAGPCRAHVASHGWAGSDGSVPLRLFRRSRSVHSGEKRVETENPGRGAVGVLPQWRRRFIVWWPARRNSSPI
jgi:hypothetical protein